MYSSSNHTQYNAYLHRPYKLYMLTETGSGVGSKPWLPFGNFYGDGTNNTFSGTFSNQYNVKQLAIVGNLDQPTFNKETSRFSPRFPPKTQVDFPSSPN